jgi:hypothetical protein
MTKDIRIKTNVLENHKILRLIYEFGDKGFISLLRLWFYAAEHRPKGILTGMEVGDIFAAMGFKKNDIPGDSAIDAPSAAKSTLEALLKIGLLEFDEKKSAYKIHDWKENQPYAYNSDKRVIRAKKGAKALREKRLRGNATSTAKSKLRAQRKASIKRAKSTAPSPAPLAGEGDRSNLGDLNGSPSIKQPNRIKIPNKSIVEETNEKQGGQSVQ